MQNIYYVLFFSILISCSSKNGKITESKPVEIVIGKNKDGYPLQNLMDIKEVIPLESTDESFIGQIERVVEHNNKLFVLDELIDKILVFRRTGEYLYSIGKKGSGPGEFQNIVDFSLLTDEQMLIAMDIEKRALIKFDLEGKFIEEIRLPFQGYRFSIYNDKIAFYTGYFNDDNSNLIITDLKGVVLDKLFKYEPNSQLMKFNFTGGITSTDNGFLYSDVASYNIYHINDKEISLKYEVDFGQHMWPNEDLLKHEDFLSSVVNGELNFLRKDFDETENAIVFEFNQYFENKVGTKFTNNPRIAFFLKRDSMTYSSVNFPKDALFNIISGPKGVIEKKLFISILDPTRLVGDVEKEAEVTKFLKDRFNINNIFVKDSEKNPVLIVYEFI